jgi:hypothetical protein
LDYLGGFNVIERAHKSQRGRQESQASKAVMMQQGGDVGGRRDQEPRTSAASRAGKGTAVGSPQVPLTTF